MRRGPAPLTPHEWSRDMVWNEGRRASIGLASEGSLDPKHAGGDGKSQPSFPPNHSSRQYYDHAKAQRTQRRYSKANLAKIWIQLIDMGHLVRSHQIRPSQSSLRNQLAYRRSEIYTVFDAIPKFASSCIRILFLVHLSTQHTPNTTAYSIQPRPHLANLTHTPESHNEKPTKHVSPP